MISSCENTDGFGFRKSDDKRYVSIPTAFNNNVRFHRGKRKKELSGSETNVIDGDNAKIGGHLTPHRRKKKTKLLKMCPGESLQSDSNVQINNINTPTWDNKDEIQLNRFDAENKKCASKENIEGVRSLDMLVDAIRLVEYQRSKNNLDPPKNGLASVSPENSKEGKNSVGKPSLQSRQCWENGGLEAPEELALDRQDRDSHCTSESVDIDGEALPRTRSKGGWLPTLPSKYSDSVLQPWKKFTRKVPKY